MSYRNPSIVNGKIEGYGPAQTREVVSLQRNGYLRVREAKHGTTVDVHHSHATRVTLPKMREALSLGTLLEGFAEAKHPRDLLGRWIATIHYGGGRQSTTPVTASSTAQAIEKAEVHARASSGRQGFVVQSVVPHDAIARQIGAEEGRRQKGADRRAAVAGSGILGRQAGDKARLRRQLETLPHGRYASMPGVAHAGSVARRTASGFDVYRSGNARVHSSHSSAADAAEEMMRIRLEKPVRASSAEPMLGVLLEAFAPPAPLTSAQTNARGARQVAAAKASLAAGWNAQKHPRAQGGRFGYTTGGKRATRSSSSHSRVIGQGASGALVKSIQRQLRLPQDGLYGPNTRAAVVRFQQQHGLMIDGIVGAQTLAALRGNPTARSIKPGPILSRAAAVRRHPSQRQRRAKVPKGAPGGGVLV